MRHRRVALRRDFEIKTNNILSLCRCIGSVMTLIDSSMNKLDIVQSIRVTDFCTDLKVSATQVSKVHEIHSGRHFLAILQLLKLTHLNLFSLANYCVGNVLLRLSNKNKHRSVCASFSGGDCSPRGRLKQNYGVALNKKSKEKNSNHPYGGLQSACVYAILFTNRRLRAHPNLWPRRPPICVKKR